MKKLLIILTIIAFIGCEKDDTTSDDKKCNCGIVRSKTPSIQPPNPSTYTVENHCTGNMADFVNYHNPDEVGVGGEYCSTSGQW